MIYIVSQGATTYATQFLSKHNSDMYNASRGKKRGRKQSIVAVIIIATFECVRDDLISPESVSFSLVQMGQ